MATDIVVPGPLKMAGRQKVALLAIIFLGLLAVITASINLSRILAANTSGDGPCRNPYLKYF
jgi:hypothetical protein